MRPYFLFVLLGSLLAVAAPVSAASPVDVAQLQPRLELLRSQSRDLESLIVKLVSKRQQEEARLSSLREEAEMKLQRLESGKREKYYLDAAIDLAPREEAFEAAKRAHGEVRDAVHQLRLELVRLEGERGRVGREIASVEAALADVREGSSKQSVPPEVVRPTRVSTERIAPRPAKVASSDVKRPPGGGRAPASKPKPGGADGPRSVVPEGEAKVGRGDAESIVLPSATGDPRALEWLERSRVGVESHDWLEAVRTASLAIGYDPGLAASYINRAWAYTEMGLLNEASADCRLVLALAPQHALAHNNCGLLHARRGESLRAQEEYEAACLLGESRGCVNYRDLTGRSCDTPRSADLLVEASYSAFQRGDWDGVVRAASLALLLAPASAQALLNRSGAYANQGNWSAAMEDVESALLINPESGLAYNNKGYVLEGMGRGTEAGLYYEMACRRGERRGCQNQSRLSR